MGTRHTESYGGCRFHLNKPSEVYFQDGTGDTNSRASVTLTQGEHDLIFIWWEGGGGAHMEISTAPGDQPNQGNPPYELLTTTVSTTNLYLSKQIPVPVRISDIVYDKGTNTFTTLTWESEVGATYTVYWTTDLLNFLTANAPLQAGVASGGASTTIGPFANPAGPNPGAGARVYFQVVKD